VPLASLASLLNRARSLDFLLTHTHTRACLLLLILVYPPATCTEVVRRQSELVLRDLKATTVRPVGAEGLAQACGAFDEPRFVAGVVSLTPGAMKDEEGVNTCSQVFIIRQGQKNSVEFTINKVSLIY